MVPPAVKRNLDFSYRHIPMLNEVSTSLSSYLASTGQIGRKKALMNWFRNTSELVAFVNKVVNDVCSKYHFEAVGKSSSGRNRILKAQRFALQMGLRQLQAEILSDILITGDGFGWIGMISKEQIKSAIKEAFSKCSYIEMKENDGTFELLKKEMDDLENELTQNYNDKIETKSVNAQNSSNYNEFFDEDVLEPKVLRYIPSSTVEVVYDRYDIKGYNHFLGVYLPMFFSPTETIHFTLMKRNGRVNGFTPVESIVVQMELLRQMWQNQLALHSNGGSPDKIFVVENLGVSSPAYAKMEQQIQKYKLAENKHGNMLFTGKVSAIELQQLDEMQFKDMGLYITGLIAMQWGIPRSSIPFILGGANTKDDTGGNSERGYWEIVRGFQETFSETWNTQLWMPYFGVKLVYENSYMQMDVQKEAALQAKITNIQGINSIMQQHKLMLSKDKIQEIIGLDDDDFEDAVELPMLTQNQGSLNTQKPKPQTEAQSSMQTAKRTEQNNTTASRGKPTGYGKEWNVKPKGFGRAQINTRYENQPHLRKDEPVQQYMESAQDKATAYDGAGAEMPQDWNITRDNKVSPAYPEHPIFPHPSMSIDAYNMHNVAGKPNEDGKLKNPPYISTPDDEEFTDNPNEPMKNPAKIKKLKHPNKGNYPTQKNELDFPIVREKYFLKESQIDMGMEIEEEHRDTYEFIAKILKDTGKLPEWEDVKKHIAKDHIDEMFDYYTKLKKMEGKKEWDDNSTLEYKSMIGSDDCDVDLRTFVKVYSEDKTYHPGKPPRIFMRKKEGVVTLKFKSNDFVYRCTVSEEKLRGNPVLMMNLPSVYEL